MQIPRFRFNAISIVEALVILILIPMSISVWKKAWSNMVYYKNFKQTLGYYSAEKWGEMDQAMNMAEESRAEDPVLMYVKANYFVESKKIKQAKEIYQSILSQGYIDVLPAKLGLLVCKLYETDEEKEKNKAFQAWSDMERELLALIKEDKNFSDAKILLGHIYYKKGLWLEEEGDKKKSKAYIDNAWQTFSDVEKSGSEFSELFLNSDTDLDNLISKSEWKGKEEQWEETDLNGDDFIDRKEMASLWNPPSKGACYSLYLGKALFSYRKAQGMWQSLSVHKPPQDDVNACVNEFRTALDYLYKATAFRVVNPDVPNAIVSLTKKMLIYPYTAERDRKELVQEALYYNQETEIFCTHLRNFRQTTKLEEWQLRARIPELYLGIAVSSYYLGNQSDSWAYFDRSSNEGSEAHRNLVRDVKMQSLVGFMDREYNQRKRLEIYANRSIYEYYERALEDLPKEGILTTREFLVLNNYIAMRYIKGRLEKILEHTKEAQNLMESYLSRIPDQKFYAQVKEDPVSAKQIATHNLYMITKYNDAKKASALKQHQLTREVLEKGK